MKPISGWGNNPKVFCNIKYPKNLNSLKKIINKKCIARGNGRSYGDSSLQPDLTIEMKNFNKILFLNNVKGLVKVQSGLLLNDLLKVIIPKGWFVPVSPGTKFVTIGGMVASNVHGKNHHKAGGFINYVDSITLINENKKIITCSKKINSNLFKSTFGGMGLTGIIIDITFRLKKIKNSYIDQKIFCTKDLKDTLKNLKETFKSTYSVGWIDCSKKNKNFGRSIIFAGEHNIDENKKLIYIKDKSITLPKLNYNYLLNSYSIKIFNFFYYNYNFLKKKKNIVNYNSYFYPLDSINNWNILYGKKGFFQYQFSIPEKFSFRGIKEILNLVQKNTTVSFLTTIKYMSKDSSILAFSDKGFTLALDFKYNLSNLNLAEKIDKLVIKYKGRIYLTKDSRINKNNLYKIYKSIKIFKKKIRTEKNKSFFSSLQSERLGL